MTGSSWSSLLPERPQSSKLSSPRPQHHTCNLAEEKNGAELPFCLVMQKSDSHLVDNFSLFCPFLSFCFFLYSPFFLSFFRFGSHLVDNPPPSSPFYLFVFCLFFCFFLPFLIFLSFCPNLIPTLWIILLPPLLPPRSSTWEVGPAPVLLHSFLFYVKVKRGNYKVVYLQGILYNLC